MAIKNKLPRFTFILALLASAVGIFSFCSADSQPRITINGGSVGSYRTGKEPDRPFAFTASEFANFTDWHIWEIKVPAGFAPRFISLRSPHGESVLRTEIPNGDFSPIEKIYFGYTVVDPKIGWCKYSMKLETSQLSHITKNTLQIPSSSIRSLSQVETVIERRNKTTLLQWKNEEGNIEAIDLVFE